MCIYIYVDIHTHCIRWMPIFDGDPPRSQVDRLATVSRSQRPRCVLNLRALQGRTSEGSADGSAAAENYADLVRRMRAEAGAMGPCLKC